MRFDSVEFGLAIVVVSWLAFWVGVACLMSLKRERELARLARSRGGVDGYAVLKRAMPDLPDDYGRLIYRSLQDIVHDGFPLLPDDRLLDTLDIDPGNLDNMIENVLESANRVALSDEELASCRFETVRDVVAYLSARPAR